MLRKADAPLFEATTKPPSSHPNQAVNSGMPISSAMTSPAAMETGAQFSRSPFPNQSTEEGSAASVPVPTRTPLCDSLTGDEKLSPEQAEIRWIMSVVLRCFGAGLVVLFVWMIVSTIMKPSTLTKAAVQGSVSIGRLNEFASDIENSLNHK